MLQRQRHDPPHHLRRRRLRVVLRDLRQVLRPLQAVRLETALVLLELRAADAAAPARLRDIAQDLGQLQHAQPVTG